MSGFNAANHIKGPAIVVFNGHSWYTENDITVKPVIESWSVNTSIFGKVDERLKSKAFEISFTPVGACVAAYLTKSFPYTVDMVGDSIYGAADVPLVIWTCAGIKHTYSRAAITKMPSIHLGTQKSAFGAMSFRCLLATSTEFTAAGAFNTLSTVVLADATFDETKLTTPNYFAAFGESPYDVIDSVDGFDIDLGIELNDTKVDRYGLVDQRLKGLTVSAKFQPAGLTEAQYLALIGDLTTAIKPGESLAKAGTSLVITGASGGLKVTLPKCGVKSGAWAFGDAERCGELEFTNRVGFTGGAATNPWTLEVVA